MAAIQAKAPNFQHTAQSYHLLKPNENFPLLTVLLKQIISIPCLCVCAQVCVCVRTHQGHVCINGLN